MTENELNETIRKNLILFRRMHGFTQSELADCIKYSDKSISKWERGEGVPGVYVLLMLSEIYDITVAELIGQSEYSKDTKEKLKAMEKDQKTLDKAKKKAESRAKKMNKKK